MKKKVRIAIVGVGNCSSSLIQGIHYYKGKSADTVNGLIHWKIGDYEPSDIEVVAAFDVVVGHEHEPLENGQD